MPAKVIVGNLRGLGHPLLTSRSVSFAGCRADGAHRAPSDVDPPPPPLAARFLIARTRAHDGRPVLIDHLFVSHFLATGTRTVEVTTVTAPQGVPSFDDDPNERIGKPGSDHAAVVATFDF